MSEHEMKATPLHALQPSSSNDQELSEPLCMTSLELCFSFALLERPALVPWLTNMEVGGTPCSSKKVVFHLTMPSMRWLWVEARIHWAFATDGGV